MKKISAEARALLDEGNFRREGGPSRLHKFFHFWLLVGRSFIRNRCPVRAAALSYATLLALIPLLAVALSVTSSLLKHEGEEKIYSAIDKFVSGVMPPATLANDGAAQPPPPASSAPAGTTPAGDTRVVAAQKEAAQRIHEFIQNTRSGALGAVGMLALVSMAIRMLANVEATFNDIWGVTRGRPWLTRVVLYWTAITLGPVLLIGALGLAGGSQFQATKAFVENMPLVGGLIFDLLPLAVLWLALALFYQLMPNTKVKFSAALAGGAVGGLLWHLNNLVGFLYVSRVVTNSRIYGGLGLVPVFMLGLYFSWLILLLGAQVAYAFQNRAAYVQDKLAVNVNQRGREFLALRLMTCVGRRFARALPPFPLQELSAELGISSKLAQQVLQPLLAARLLTEISGAEPAYVPARPLDAINAHHVLLALRAGGGQELPPGEEPARAEVYGEFARIEEAERQAAASVTLLALVEGAQRQIENSPPAPAEG
ncbi:MAG: YihY family inner membrane protein [Verrucomicrobiota bacterium]|nr:YihY family inner membrane protein [Verrucomicrobiota bacterium]